MAASGIWLGDRPWAFVFSRVSERGDLSKQNRLKAEVDRPDIFVPPLPLFDLDQCLKPSHPPIEMRTLCPDTRQPDFQYRERSKQRLLIPRQQPLHALRRVTGESSISSGVEN